MATPLIEPETDPPPRSQSTIPFWAIVPVEPTPLMLPPETVSVVVSLAPLVAPFPSITSMPFFCVPLMLEWSTVSETVPVLPSTATP